MAWNKELLDKAIQKSIPALTEEIMALNDDLACHPELGAEEYRSSEKIVALLWDHGLTVEYPFCDLKTAFKASINPGGSKKIALLVEYDALPGIGHACGHCASGMASIMAALALHEAVEQLEDLQIDVIGTPDEEVEGRKATMAKKHVFDGYDFVAMAHMGGGNTLEVNFIALDGMIFEFRGKSAHAAQAPEKGRNALNAVRLLFDSVDMMRQHVIPEARIHGYIADGGIACNIVPDYASAKFLARAPKREQLDDITAWVKDCARAAAMATRTELSILPYGEGFDELHISPAEHQIMEECFEDLGLPLDKQLGGFVGSSDVGNVDAVCPAFHPVVGIGQKLDVHTPEFGKAMSDVRTHQGIINAAQVLLTLICKVYEEPGKLAQIQKEFHEYRG